MEERHRGGEFGGALGDLLLQAVVEAAQVIGLFLRHLRIMRHLEDLEALIGLFAGDHLFESLVLLEVGQGLSSVAQLF